MKKYRKAQAVLQYSLLIACITGVALIMQVYIGRSIKGRIRATGDSLAEQYALGDIDLHENFRSDVSTTEWMLPGPINTSIIRGTFKSTSQRKLQPLPVQ